MRYSITTDRHATVIINTSKMRMNRDFHNFDGHCYIHIQFKQSRISDNDTNLSLKFHTKLSK